MTAFVYFHLWGVTVRTFFTGLSHTFWPATAGGGAGLAGSTASPSESRARRLSGAGVKKHHVPITRPSHCLVRLISQSKFCKP